MRLFRGAQRLLQLEEQLLDEVDGGQRRLAHRRALDRRFHRPGGRRRPGPPLRVPPRHPDLHVSLEVHDTQTVVDLVADRGLELGIVGAARRHRGVRFDPLLRRRGDPHLPAGARVRGAHGHRRRAPRRDADPDAGGGRSASGRRGRAAAPGRAAARPLRLARARSPGVGPERSARRLRRHVHLEERGRVGSRGGDARRGAARGDGARSARSRSRGRRGGRRHARPKRSSPSSASARPRPRRGSAAAWVAATTRRRLTTPATRPSSLSTGRWRKPCSSITRAASSTSVSAWR